MQAFLQKLRENEFLKNVVLIASGTAAAQVITLISTPAITRIYSPDHMGVLTVFTSILGIIGQLSTLRYSVTIPLAESEETAYDIIQLCFIITIIFSFILLLCVMFCGDYIAGKYDLSGSRQYFWLISLCFLGFGFYESLSSWALRQKKFKILAKTKLSQSISSAVLKIGLGLLGIKPLGLIIGFFSSQASGIITIFRQLLKLKSTIFRDINFKRVIIVAKRYSNFPLVQSWSKLLLAFGVYLPPLCMATYYGTREAGYFGLAISMVSMPMNLIGASVSQVYYAEIAKYGVDRIDKIYSLSFLITKRMVAVGILPIGSIVLIGPWLFALIFGKQWHEAGVYAQLLAISVFGQFVTSPIMHVFDVLEKQFMQLLFNASRIVLFLIAFYFSSRFGYSPRITITFYSFIIFIYYILVLITTYVFLQKIKGNIHRVPNN